jgi:hypothetical protein
MSRRIGKFEIAAYNIEAHPEMVEQIMGKVIVVRCEQMYDTASFSYTALSEYFDVVELGEMIPKYQVIHDGSIVRFERI